MPPPPAESAAGNGNDVGNDVGKDVGNDVGKDVGNDVGKDVGKDVGNDVGKDVGRLDQLYGDIDELDESSRNLLLERLSKQLEGSKLR